MEDVEFLESELSPEDIDRLNDKYECVLQITKQKNEEIGYLTALGRAQTICKGIGYYLGESILAAKATDESFNSRDSLYTMLAEIKKHAKRKIRGEEDEEVISE